MARASLVRGDRWLLGWTIRLLGFLSLCAACGSSEQDPFSQEASGGRAQQPTGGEGDSAAGGGSSAASGGAEGGDPEPGSGGAPPVDEEQACSRYRQQFCNYLIDCGLVTGAAAECVAELEMFIDCRSVRLANECAEVFPTAPCREFPVGCDLSDVADSAEAMAACDAFGHALCEASVACGDDYDTCRQVLDQELSCSTVIALAADPQPCLDALSTLACEDELPETCFEILI